MNTPAPVTNWALLDLLPVGIVVLSRDYTVLFWNQCMEGWTGIRHGEITGTILFSRFPSLDSPRYRTRIDQVFAGGPAALFSSQLHPHFIPAPQPDGTLRVQNVSVVPVQAGSQYQAMIVIEDVTVLVRQVRALREMKSVADTELAKRTRAQDALNIANTKLNILSSLTRHDILNKITAISGYLYLLSASLPDEPKPREIVGKIGIQIAVISRFLALTREYDQFGVEEPGWQDVESLVRKAADDVFLGGVTVAYSSPGLEIFADRMLEKVIFNLFDNAKSHGQTVSKITVSFQREAGHGLLVIDDDGVGIPADQKMRIFEKGFGSNTGLGLFLSKEILHLTGIGISETGDPGKGARFELTIPAGGFRFPENPL